MMESPQLALLLSRRAVLHESHSARPDAPVVAPRPRRERPPVARRTRGVLATALHHLGDAVAPRCTPSGAHPAH
ncbi:hypothetical protein [Cellulomonas cellasea]|uniref:Uncharacterized protein n=1 Tax=Cellulomonas cellasea TaxID=43670 RepID=A0A7W4UFM8_9CELL|nr:hypothetical protein [Cellulomonas cellasea]MBB2923307.1 hypothetical protein [Cellulomonas cellasea]